MGIRSYILILIDSNVTLHVYSKCVCKTRMSVTATESIKCKNPNVLYFDPTQPPRAGDASEV